MVHRGEGSVEYIQINGRVEMQTTEQARDVSGQRLASGAEHRVDGLCSIGITGADKAQIGEWRVDECVGVFHVAQSVAYILWQGCPCEVCLVVQERSCGIPQGSDSCGVEFVETNNQGLEIEEWDSCGSCALGAHDGLNCLIDDVQK